MSLMLVLLQQVVPLQAEDRWQKFLERLPNLDAQQFRDQVAKPLVELSANAYRYPDVTNIPGWVPSQYVAPIAPAEGGVHALVYEVLHSTALRIAIFILEHRGLRARVRVWVGVWVSYCLPGTTHVRGGWELCVSKLFRCRK